MCFPPWLVNELAVVPRQIIKASSLVVAVVSLAALGDDGPIHACLAGQSVQEVKVLQEAHYRVYPWLEATSKEN